MENWKSVPGYSGYEISDKGRARSYKKRGGYSFHSTPHLLKPTQNERYVGINLSRDGVVYFCRIHRLVMFVFVGKCPVGMEVCHNNSNTHDNRLTNLRYDTPKHNAEDRVKITQARNVCIRNKYNLGLSIEDIAKEYGLSTAYTTILIKPKLKSKLTKEQVKEIRQRRKTGELLKSIANDFCISEGYVSRLAHRIYRKNVK